MAFTYLFILFSLASVVAILIARIRKLKQQHDNAMRNLYDYLNQLSEELQFADEKVKFTTDFRKSLSDAQNKLNKDIFDLQMVLFDEKFKK